jgi:hypothetical protein
MLRTLLGHHQGLTGNTETTTNISTRCYKLIVYQQFYPLHILNLLSKISISSSTYATDQNIKYLFYTTINILPSDRPGRSKTCSLVFDVCRTVHRNILL